MKILSKSGVIEIEVYIDPAYKDKKFYEIVAYNANKKEIGNLNFSIHKNGAWLYIIETNKEYQHRGIGQSLLNVMEYMLVKSSCYHIEGKYYPKNRFAKPFYLKNNFKIENDDYE